MAIIDWLAAAHVMFTRIGQLGFVGRASLLAVSLLLVWGLVSPLAVSFGGVDSLLSASVAAGLCGASAGLALAVMDALSAPRMALVGLLIGMLARMFVPLAIGLWVYVASPRLAGAGFVYYLLIFYLLTLLVETVLVLAKVQSGRAISKSS